MKLELVTITARAWQEEREWHRDREEKRGHGNGVGSSQSSSRVEGEITGSGFQPWLFPSAV